MPNRTRRFAGLTLLAMLGRAVWRENFGGAASQSAGLTPPAPAPSRYGWLKLLIIGALTVIAALVVYFYTEQRLDQKHRLAAIDLTGGNPDAAPAWIIQYGCAGCHAIPGIPEAAGQIGPPLNNLARQGYVGGVVENTTDNLVNWIVDPRAIDPMSAMPRTGISPAEARDVAAYLLSLRS